MSDDDTGDVEAGKVTVSGVWSGRFWYAPSEQRIPATVPFTALISDLDGRLTGSTLEPNSFAFNDLEELSGAINGARDAYAVNFMKVYDPAPGVHQVVIFYTGEVEAGCNRIEGGWTMRHGVDVYTGGFEMARVSSVASISRSASIAL